MAILLLSVVLGVVVGFVAQAITWKKPSMDLFTACLWGGAGSLAGGIAGTFVSGSTFFESDATATIGSGLGALAVLAVLGLTSARPAPAER
jgi:uncharacterized membrane protein YeaQ/YmgE (transglycosylase-associated protein family)